MNLSAVPINHEYSSNSTSLTCSIRRSSQSEENMPYMEDTSFRYPVSMTKFYVRFS